MIKCICSYFNYYNDDRRKQNYIKFRKHFAHDLVTVELAKDKSEFFIDDAIQIVAKPENLLWQKERCFNIALESLPDTTDKIVWVDTDIIFHNDNWLRDLDKILDNYAVAQPFQRVVELDNDYNHNLNCFGYANLIFDYLHNEQPIPISTAPGLSWGCSRSALPNGFYDKHIMGSNDAMQIYSWIGDIFNVKIFQMPNSLILDFLDYYKQVDCDSSQIAYCKGVVEHLYHGCFTKRGYNSRGKIISENFDVKDLEIDGNGLYKLNNKEKMNEIRTHFYSL